MNDLYRAERKAFIPEMTAAIIGAIALFVTAIVAMFFGWPEETWWQRALMASAGMLFALSLGAVCGGVVLMHQMWKRTTRSWLIAKWSVLIGGGLGIVLFLLGLFLPILMPLAHMFTWLGLSVLAGYLLLGKVQPADISFDRPMEDTGSFRFQILDMDPGKGAPPETPLLDAVIPMIQNEPPPEDDPKPRRAM